MRHPPSRPSRRSIANHLEGLSALALGTTPVFTAPSKRTGKRGKQKESAVNDAAKDWARLRGGVLYRNRRGMVRTGGGMFPYGLGPNGYGDLVGYLTITVTPAMVGKRIAAFAMVESKFDENEGPEPHQQKYIDEVRDAGGISGCAHNASDCEEILARYLAKVGSDERLELGIPRGRR